MFEYAIRPFQSPAPHGRTIIPSTPRDTREKAILTWGAKTTVTGGIQGRGVNVVCCREEASEVDRDSDGGSVVNAAYDPRNTFTVVRASKIRFDKTDSNDCIKGWDQMSGVAAAVDEWMAEFTADLHAGTGDTKVGCQHLWTLSPSNTRTGNLIRSTHDVLESGGMLPEQQPD